MLEWTKFSEFFVYGISAGKDGQHTLKFCNGEFSIDKNIIFIKYVSESTGATREGEFYKENISGFVYSK